MLPALALLAAQAATPAAPAYPAAAVVTAFAEACSGVGDWDHAADKLEAAGWTRFAPAADSALGALLAKGRAELGKVDASAAMRDGRSFRRTVDGETLELTLSRVELDDGWSNGCRVYDFGESRPLPVAAVTARIGRAPNQDATTAALNKAEWNPGLAPGMMSTELYFVPAGSPAASLLGSSGIVLVAQAMGAQN